MVLGLEVVETISEATEGTAKKPGAQWNFLLPRFASSLLRGGEICKNRNQNPSFEPLIYLMICEYFECF